jgi:hypothetical protein
MLSEQTTTNANQPELSDVTNPGGRLIDHDISISENTNPAAPSNIPISKGDPDFDPPVDRSG